MRHYSIWPGNYAIVIPRQLREHLEAAGWSKTDIPNSSTGGRGFPS